jgi:hypothetical protein
VTRETNCIDGRRVVGIRKDARHAKFIYFEPKLTKAEEEKYNLKHGGKLTILGKKY